jgi:hypothetical protein
MSPNPSRYMTISKMQGHAKKNLFMILILLSKRLMFNILNSEKNINLKITPFRNSRTANYFLNPIEYNQGKARIDGEQKVSGSNLHGLLLKPLFEKSGYPTFSF